MSKKPEPLPEKIANLFPFRFEKAAEIKVPEVRLMIDELPSGGLRLNYTSGFLSLLKPPETDTAVPHKFQDQADEALDAIATRKDASGAAVSPFAWNETIQKMQAAQEPCPMCDSLCPDCDTGKKGV